MQGNNEKTGWTEAEKPTLVQKLGVIQLKLKAPKNQRNTFGGYNYRSAEDILEAVKPLAIANGALVNITDDIVSVGERIYVKATVRLIDLDTGDHLETSAMAREEEAKKGMDGSQITGAASSYARKYALNGMFAIDDTKDSDATNDHGRGNTPKPMTASQIVAAAKPSTSVSKAKEAWALYVKKPDNEGVDGATLKQNFGKMCSEICGRFPKEMTDADWDKIIGFVKDI